MPTLSHHPSHIKGDSHRENKNDYVAAKFTKDGEHQELFLFAISEDSFSRIERDVASEMNHQRHKTDSVKS